MTCSLAEGVELDFRESYLSIGAYDLRTRESRSRYSHVKAKISKKSANKLAERGFDKEPVEVNVNGNFVGRFMYPEDTLRISENEAWIKLYDARKILDYGVLSKEFSDVSVKNVVRYAMDNREDPYDVLTGYKVLSNKELKKEKQDLQEDIVEFIHGDDADAARSGLKGFANDILAGGLNATADALSPLTNEAAMKSKEFKGLTLDESTPNDAIRQVESMFSAVSWVTEDGQFRIGSPEDEPTSIHTFVDHKAKKYPIKEYNITKGASRITRVRLRGKTGYYGGNWKGDGIGGDGSFGLFPVAEAWVSDPETGEQQDGETVSNSEPVEIWKLGALKTAARNQLLSAQMEHRNGNIKLNSTAATKQAEIAKMEVGDRVFVTDQVGQQCEGNSEGGSFVVTEVQHTVNFRSGWKTTIQVSGQPPFIDTMGVYYNPDKPGEAYDSIESYKEAHS